ncbi:hypothetical protein H2204_004353 [Knufia peltigerae]|uniref:Major facilitator superfamily (MFS) profile domain-containing protein n=1 Tax=Knufia peltigerae TaxID=1002370 RepID=A0AA39CYS3_9EURO|nr:hypothetical protein H2204_004353 [Knufia peltigerae]
MKTSHCSGDPEATKSTEQNILPKPDQNGPDSRVPVELGAEDPRRLSTPRKWVIVLISSLIAHVVTAGSSIYTLAYDQFNTEWGTSRELATAGLSLYTLAMGLGPLLVAPLSEFYGADPSACGRFFSGAASSAFLSVAGGTVGDLFDHSQLQTPMLVYSITAFLGPDVGPIFGGFICQYTTWRWSFYALMIWIGVLMVLFYFFSPETYAPLLLRRKSERLRREQGLDVDKKLQPQGLGRTILISCTRPFKLLVLEYMLLSLCILTAFTLGIQYLLFGGFAYVFRTVYRFELSEIGLTFIGIGVGAFIGLAMDPLWRKYRDKQLKENSGNPEPEFRLPAVAFGALCLPVSLFFFGWTARPSVHWIVPIIGSGFFGVGGLLVYSGIWTFLVEAYPVYAASALGANAFTRLAAGAAFPLFGVQMYESLGVGWASSLLGFLALAAAPFPFLLMKYGKRIRGASKFAKA